MNKTIQKPPLKFPYLIKNINFIVTFVTGLSMAFGFAKLLSLSITNPCKEAIKAQSECIKIIKIEHLPPFLIWINDISTLYLSLILAGALGGLLYSVLLDDELELPSWSKVNPNNLNPGFLKEIFVGIGGAFVAYIALPDSLKKFGVIDRDIIIFVTGLVGGYGGKAILDAALKKVINRIETAELAKENAETQANELAEGKRLLDLVSQQIHEGLNPSELSELQERLKVANPEAKDRAFSLTRDARGYGRRAAEVRDRVKRTVPIFEMVIATDSDEPEYHAQLAYAEIDLDPPLLDDAVYHLNQAIQLRGESIQGTTWKYELHRAIARILILKQQGVKGSTDAHLSESILKDLSVVDRNKGLAKAIDQYKAEGIDLPIEGWLTQNQDWVSQQTNRTLLDQIKLTPLAKTVTPSVAPASLPFPPSQVVKNGSAREAINQLPRVSALLTTNTGTLRAAATRLAQGSATATKVRPHRWDMALAKAPTTGASNTTAKSQIGMSGGIDASIKLAENDWGRIEPLIERFYIAAAKHDVPPALLAAIASRESHVGTALKNGLGDKGNAFGIMQVDKRHHSQAGASGDPANQTHINQGAEIFDTKRKEVTQKHRDWSDEYILKGATAAYNVGSKNIQTKIGIDWGTTGNDYGSDVIARAQCYSKRMKSLAECKADQTQRSAFNGGQPTSMRVLPEEAVEQRITALKDTFLKKHPLQTSQLAEDQKRAVAKGQSYPVEDYKEAEGGHYWVRLGHDAGEWYIYDADEDGHWDTSWEGDETETEAPATPDQGKGDIHNTPGSVNWSDSSQRISKYFTACEVTLNHSDRRPKPNSEEEKNILNLAKELDKIREDFGSPIRVTSWYRPRAVNKLVGGVSNSQHIYGRGVDIQPVKGDILGFQKWLDKDWHGALGYGARKGFVHLDTRNGQGWKTGGPKGVRWNY